MKNVAIRQGFGEALLELAEQHKELVVLDADVASSTQTIHFGKRYPERFFNVGVAEANMVDVAAGMATAGLRPVVSSFAIFLTLKAAEQIRNIVCYNNLPVILVGGYGGLSDSFDGASHQSITDIAVMRAFPNMTVVTPGDAIDTKKALEQALKINGPVYIRGSRNPSPVFSESYDDFKIGKARRLFSGTDISVFVNGIPTPMAIDAVKSLTEKGVSVDLVEVSTVKPLDKATILESAKKTNKVLTIEEHNIIGGLGSAISELLSREYPVKMDFVGINDTFTETGPYDELLQKYGLSAEKIVQRILKHIN
jgi:transketolase